MSNPGYVTTNATGQSGRFTELNEALEWILDEILGDIDSMEAQVEDINVIGIREALRDAIVALQAKVRQIEQLIDQDVWHADTMAWVFPGNAYVGQRTYRVSVG